MKPSCPIPGGSFNVALCLAAGLIVIAVACGEGKTTIAPADQTTVNANQSNSAAWSQEKATQKTTKK